MEEDREVQEENKKSGYYINKPTFGNKGPSKIREQFNRAVYVVIVIVLCIMFYFLLLRLEYLSRIVRMILDVLRPVIYGLAFAFLLNPIVKFVDRHLKPILNKHISNARKAFIISRSAGILTAVIALLVVIVALCNMLIPELYRSIRDMVLTVPEQLNDAIDAITKMLSNDTTLGQVATSLLREVTDYLQNWMRTDLLTQVNGGYQCGQ